MACLTPVMQHTLRAVALADLLVARTDAVQEGDAARRRSPSRVNATRPSRSIRSMIDRRIDVVVQAVTVLLLHARRRNRVEARTRPPPRRRPAVRPVESITPSRATFSIDSSHRDAHLDVAGGEHDARAVRLEHLVRRRERTERVCASPCSFPPRSASRSDEERRRRLTAESFNAVCMPAIPPPTTITRFPITV